MSTGLFKTGVGTGIPVPIPNFGIGIGIGIDFSKFWDWDWAWDYKFRTKSQEIPKVVIEIFDNFIFMNWDSFFLNLGLGLGFFCRPLVPIKDSKNINGPK